MTRRTASVLVYGTAAVAVCLLSYGGYRYVKLLRNVQQMGSDTRVGKLGERSFRIYRRGTPEEATQALLENAALLERERGRWTSKAVKTSHAYDLALTYERLAIVAAKRGDLEGQDRYHALARNWLLAAFPRDANADIRALVEKWDAAGDRGLASEVSPAPRVSSPTLPVAPPP